MNEITKETQLAIVDNKIQLYVNSRYDAEVDAKVADITDDENLKKSAQERVKKIIKALDALEKIKAELQKAV